MKKLLITALMLIGLASSALAQDEVLFTIMKTDGSTTDFVMNKDARIYYSDTQLQFFDGNQTVSINFSEIRKAYFTEPQDVEEIDNQQFAIYPNPAKDVLGISGIAENQEVTIYSINGAVMMKLIASEGSEINISDLRTGLYIIGVGNEFSKFIKM